MKLTAILKGIAKKSTLLRVIMRKTMYSTRKVLYIFRGISVKMNENLIVFSAYNGKSYACSPKAVYEYMVRNKQFDNYQFVWLFDNPEKYQFLKRNPRTEVIKNQSVDCEKYLHQAKYWIFNFRAMDQWYPNKNQIYVQCWHGTPLKRLGYDINNSDNAMNSVSEIREKYRTDAERFQYMVSPCRFVTEKFVSAWDLKNAGKEDAILEIGYPRNDFLHSYNERDVERVKELLGIEKSSKKIILYAPTWRDNQYNAQIGYVYENPVDFDALRKSLEKDYIILFRAHYLVADSFDFDAYKGFVYDVSKYDDINELYIIADMLITDYSSVFFDYAILERPMLFYMYDMEEYRDEMRGFYLNIEELPGPIVTTEKELINAVSFIECNDEYKEEMRRFNEEYNRMNDGRASERFVNRIINNN